MSAENRKEYAICIFSTGVVNIATLGNLDGGVRSIVGGDPEMLPVVDFLVSDPLAIAFDEAGKKKKKPYNYLASVLVGAPVYGNAALVEVGYAGSVPYTTMMYYAYAEILEKYLHIADKVLAETPAGQWRGTLAETVVA